MKKSSNKKKQNLTNQKVSSKNQKSGNDNLSKSSIRKPDKNINKKTPKWFYIVMGLIPFIFLLLT